MIATMIMIYLIALLVGASVGSFLGVFVERQNGLPRKFEKKATGLMNRSFCFFCGHELAWRENIPIFSYVLLRGRCSRCHSPIPYWLPLIEIAGGGVGVVLASFMSHMGLMSLMGLMVVSVSFLWIFFSDLVYGVIPDLAVAIGAIGAIGIHLGEGNPMNFFSSIGPFVLPAMGTALFFLTLVVITRGRGMGTGDVTLGALVGFLLGWPRVLLGVWIGFVSGAVIAVALLIVGRKRLEHTIPFGPFLVVGTIVAWSSHNAHQVWFQCMVTTGRWLDFLRCLV